VRQAPPRGALPFCPALLLLLLAFSAIAASPPVPGKKGPQAPRYGRSSSGTGETPPLFRSLRAQAPLLGAATYNVLAVRVAFTDTPIDSSTAYYDRLLLFLNQYWNQMSDGQVTITPTLWDSVFTLPHPMSYYGDDDRFQERLVYMVRDMVAAADSTVDFRPYQSIVIFHAINGQRPTSTTAGNRSGRVVTPDDFAQILPARPAPSASRRTIRSAPAFYRVKDG
jgi:hypothetical protein